MDVRVFDQFYNQEIGQLVRRTVEEKLPLFERGRSLLSLGYVKYYNVPEKSWGIPSVIENVPVSSSNQFFYEEKKFPLGTDEFDDVLMLHALEFANNPDSLLKEVWRVLKSDGVLHLFVPNRRGFWARGDTNPFGQGQPYSKSQIEALLNACDYKLETAEPLLFFPSWKSPLSTKVARLFEGMGRMIFPGMGGVFYIKARKDMFSPELKTDAQRKLTPKRV